MGSSSVCLGRGLLGIQGGILPQMAPRAIFMQHRLDGCASCLVTGGELVIGQPFYVGHL